MRRVVAIIIVLSLALLLCACGHQHTWIEATCTAPKTCSECGKTEGVPIEHTWVEATCTAPKTCSVCGITEGEPLNHIEGEWEIISEPTLLEAGEKQKKCSRCGEVLDTQITDKKKIEYNNGVFNFTREEYVEYFEDAMNSRYTVRDAGNELDPLGGHAYSISQYGKIKAFLSFIENKNGGVNTVAVWGEEIDTLYIAIYTFTVMCGIDADEKTDEIFSSLDKNNTYTLNGLKMTFKGEGGDYFSLRFTGA